MSTSWSRHWGSASTPLIRGCPTASALRRVGGQEQPAPGLQHHRRYESYYASYADSRKWVKEGWIDYICPQIYWYIGHKSMDYATVARWWADTVKGTGVSLYIGMADYLAGNSDPKSPWYGTTAIERQLALNDTLPQVAGEAHFRYRLMAENPELLALYAEAYGRRRRSRRSGLSEHQGARRYIQGNDGRFRRRTP